MHALVSILPKPFSQQVEALWDELEEEHGLAGIRVTPYPHFSWQIGEDYNLPALEALLGDVVKSTAPLIVRTTGIGIFTGPRPVIFIPVVKNAALIDFHTQLWEQTQDIGQGLSPYYNPQNWIPHISLAYEDIDLQNITSVIQALAYRDFIWEMRIDNLAFIYEPDSLIGSLGLRYQLLGMEEDPR